MTVKAPYRTRQQVELIKYLRATPGQHYTAAQLREHFASGQKTIGATTIYRQLEKLEAEGVVRKYALGTGDSACYEYVEQRDACAAHFHCKCEKCGRLIHLDCPELQEIRGHLKSAHGFSWDTGRTVFYGVCDQCRTD